MKSPKDAKANVRIERTNSGLKVTDLYKGNLPQGSGSSLLAIGLKAEGIKTKDKFTIAGIINLETLEAFRNGVPAEQSLLGKTTKNALKKLGLEPSKIQYSQEKGKLSLTVEVK